MSWSERSNSYFAGYWKKKVKLILLMSQIPQEDALAAQNALIKKQELPPNKSWPPNPILVERYNSPAIYPF
jgi:hypothetical protein